jgi:hypothetical protein
MYYVSLSSVHIYSSFLGEPPDANEIYLGKETESK